MNHEIMRLRQIETIRYFKNTPKVSEMITVCLSKFNDSCNYSIYPVLVPKDIINKIMNGDTWNFNYKDGYPEIFKSDEIIEYSRYGNNEGLEPLIITRNFYDIKEEYIEISEEFRLFHRLYYDSKENKYYKIVDGNEDLIIDIQEDEIKIRLKELKEFLVVKKMYLVLQFDMKEYSLHKLKKLSLSENEYYKDDFLIYHLNYGDFGRFSKNNAFSRLLGKKSIAPFENRINRKINKFVEYIIDVDDNGNEVSFTSNPDVLSNSFTPQKDTPDYLTAVFFKKRGIR